MLNKDKARQIHEDINAALKAVADKHGLNVGGGSLRYTTTDFKFATTFALKGQTGEVEVDPKLVMNHKRFAFYVGLGDKLGKTFNDTRLGEVTYVGMTSRDKAICRAKDGKMYKFAAEVVARNIK